MADPAQPVIPPWPENQEEFIQQFIALQNQVAFLHEQMENVAQFGPQAQPAQPPQAEAAAPPAPVPVPAPVPAVPVPPIAPVAPAAAPAQGPTMKFAKPDDFYGDSGKVDTFLRQCHTYFIPFPNATDQTKIAFALLYMKGPVAGRWADRQHEAIQNSEPNAIQVWDGPGGFVGCFKDIFGDPDRQATARHKLALLRQGSKTAEQFIIDFEVLEAEANLGDGALVEHFKKGLLPRLVERIFGLETLPTTLREWKDYARRFDRHHRQFLEWQSQTRSSPAIPRPRPLYRPDFQGRRFQQNPFRPRQNTSNQAAPARAPDVVPMEVDHTRRWGGNSGPRPIVCYKCGEEGHRQYECPNPGRARNVRAVQAEEPTVAQQPQEEAKDNQGFAEDQAVEA